MDDHLIAPEPVLHRFGLTWRAIAIPLGIGGAAVACILSAGSDQSPAAIAWFLVTVTGLFLALLAARARCATVVRPDGITVTTFGRRDRTVEWQQLLDIRVSQARRQPTGWEQALLFHRAPDGSIESLAAPHISTHALGTQLHSAVSYLHEQWSAATDGQPVERDPDGVDKIERERLADLARRAREARIMAPVYLGLAIVTLALILVFVVIAQTGL